jgi:hypothetical protein
LRKTTESLIFRRFISLAQVLLPKRRRIGEAISQATVNTLLFISVCLFGTAADGVFRTVPGDPWALTM